MSNKAIVEFPSSFVIVPGPAGSGGGSVIPVEIETEGEWQSSFTAFAVAPGTLSFYPFGLQITAAGCWAQSVYFEEDTETGLTSIAFPNLAGVVGDFELEYFADAAALALPELVVTGGSFQLYSMATCTEIDLPKLRAVGNDFQIAYSNYLTAFEAPALEYADRVEFYDNGALETISLPALKFTRYIYVVSNSDLTDLSFPVLREVPGSFELSGNPSLTSIAFAALERIGYVGMGWNCGSIANFSYGEHLIEARGTQTFGGCSLMQESVDHVLTTLAGLDGENGTVAFTAQVYIAGSNAIPSEAGLAAIGTLVGRGCYVDFNPPPED